MLLVLLCVLLATLHSATAVAPLVDVGYAKYQGKQNNAITQWLGIRYAAKPLGKLRFATPQDPVKMADTQPALQHGPACLSTSTSIESGTSEDCLFLDVYAPSKAKAGDKLPVYLFIQGGGFNANANANINGSGLIRASGMNMIVVNFNYRVGIWGFLASKEIAANGSINNGLKDQRKVMEWVQRHIGEFGGDPNHVSLGGVSAGAGSVALHLTAYGGRNDNLFHATAAESQAFPPLRTVVESQYMYDNLVGRAGCNSTTAKSKDTLACLRGMGTAALQNVNTNNPFPSRTRAPLWPYGPVLDNDMIRDYTYSAFDKGAFLKLPAIFGDVTNEGTLFAPKEAKTVDEMNRFVMDQFSRMSPKQVNQLAKLYPKAEQFPDTAAYWRSTANMFGELRYNCPGIYISSAYARHNVTSSWNYHWDVLTEANAKSGYGVTHVSESASIFADDDTVNAIQGYWQSFIRSYDPNAQRNSDTPEWESWGKSGYERIHFQANGTTMETVPASQKQRCAYVSSIGLSLRQ
ncbi:Alpha/Beta hydrolase protein [Cryomyces antarcticus]